MNSLFHTNGVKSLINEFQYPMLGPGMMWENFKDKTEESGGEVKLNSDVIAINHNNNRINSMVINSEGKDVEIKGDYFISSMPVSELIKKMNPKVPDKVENAAGKLAYRALILVGLIINKKIFSLITGYIFIVPSLKLEGYRTSKTGALKCLPILRRPT